MKSGKYIGCVLALAMAIVVLAAVKAQAGGFVYIDENGDGVFNAGEWNGTSIQDAVNNATEGQTIYVWEGEYYEDVFIDKTLTIIGNTTVNMENGTYSASTSLYYTEYGFWIEADYVNISGFYIEGGVPPSGIHLNGSNYCNISGNVITNDPSDGICIENSSHNVVYNNIIENNNVGILIINSSYNRIYENNITNNQLGIWITKNLGYHSYNTIEDNNIFWNYLGIELDDVDNETIIGNNISWNSAGIYAYSCENITINNDNHFIYNDFDYYAIYFEKVNHSEIVGNTMLYNPIGIYMENCKGNTVSNNEINGSWGEGESPCYYIYVKTSDGWKLQKELHLFKRYSTIAIDLSDVLPDVDGEYKVRITHHGGIAAHIDYVALQGMQPSSAMCIDDGRNILQKVMYEDKDVADVWEKTIELLWDGIISSPVLVITANEEPFANELPILTPRLMLPHLMMPYEIQNNGAITIDGIPDDLGEEDFSAYWMPSSGHPWGYTYLWLRSDGEYLYAVMEITSDNTYDETGWASLYIYTDGEVKEFRIDSTNHEYGVDGFVYTDKVEWQHMVYEFKIPLEEIKAGIGDIIKIGYGSYGTEGIEATGIMISSGYIDGRRCYNIIQNNNISNFVYGISLYFTDNETIIGNNITFNAVGIYADECENITVEDNNVSSNIWGWWHGTGGIIFDTVRDSTVKQNYIVNNVEGIYLGDTRYIDIIENYIAWNLYDTGIYIYGESNHTNITGNTIINNDIGIYVYGGYEGSYANTDTEIHWNKIYNNSIYGLLYEISEGETPYINATYNFWGNGNGPSNTSMIDPITGMEANGEGDAIGGGVANDNIHFDPWIGKLILYQGWNFITLPVWNESISTAEELGEYINDKAGYKICTVITKWNPLQQRYISHVIGFGADFDLIPGEAYFLFVGDDFNVSINGTIIEPEVNITLRVGYNVIGHTKVIPTDAKELGENINNCIKIGGWNASSQMWRTEYIIGSIGAKPFEIIIGDGVFVHIISGTQQWHG